MIGKEKVATPGSLLITYFAIPDRGRSDKVAAGLWLLETHA